MKHSACDLIEKEADNLKEIVQLKSIRDMALELDITERTVKYRISRIFEKTGTNNQREQIRIIYDIMVMLLGKDFSSDNIIKTYSCRLF